MLLHGAGADATQWVDIGLAAAVDRVASRHVTPLVAVAPDVDPASVSPFVLETLLPAIEQRDHPHGAFAISGISRGAGEALAVATAAPHRFESVGLHSPAVPPLLVPTNALGPVFIDAGSADPLRADARRLAAALRSVGVSVTTSWPLGRHDRTYWRAHLRAIPRLPPRRARGADVTAGRTTAPVVRRLTLLGLAAVGTIGAGILVVTPDGNGFLQPLDSAVHRAARSIGWSSGRSSVLTLSLVLPAIAALLAAIWFGASRANRDTLAPLAALGLALAVTAPIALLVRRPIPGDVGVLRAAAADHSFPSVAAAMTTALAVTVAARTGGLEARRRAFAIGAVAIALTSAIRVVSGTTWFLDEVVGIALGFLAANVVTPLLPAHTRRHPRRALAAGAAAVAAVALLAPIGSSYAGYLRAPGNVNGSERTIEFLRDHGLGPVVDRAESWWLWSHLPPSHGTIYALPAPPMSAPCGRSGRGQVRRACVDHGPPTVDRACVDHAPSTVDRACLDHAPSTVDRAGTDHVDGTNGAGCRLWRARADRCAALATSAE